MLKCEFPQEIACRNSAQLMLHAKWQNVLEWLLIRFIPFDVYASPQRKGSMNKYLHYLR